MSFFDRLSNGWKISKTCFTVLSANKQLIVFPLLSGISLILILGSFLTALSGGWSWDTEMIFDDMDNTTMYLYIFLYYLVNYFIVVFFNMALVHCTKLYFDGEQVSIVRGIRFSISRIGSIFAWALFAATVGLVLRIIQENVGWIGKIITGIIGFVWGIGTFFVVPVIAYEKSNPVEAFKRSAEMMKAKWGESLGASFSFGLVQFVAIISIMLVSVLIGSVYEDVGIAVFVLSVVTLVTIMSALNTIFVSAVYNNINGKLSIHFNQQMFDSLFVEKEKGTGNKDYIN